MTENTQRIAELQRELAGNPASRQFYQLGELLRRDGRFGEATEVLNAGLVNHPRYMAAWVALGRACLENGKARDAVGGLEQALVLDPQNPVAWRLLGEARLVLGNRLGALDAMTRCLDLVPGDDVLKAAVDALASETAPPAPPVEYAPMPEAAGAPAEPAAESPVTEPAFELELP
ncbi:MAG: tetratricopeptide repeat protein, partial [Acidobacteriia bacterium]|nr:tetratricopeptide repeat protein [Terriglobia bacterium]